MSQLIIEAARSAHTPDSKPLLSSNELLVMLEHNPRGAAAKSRMALKPTNDAEMTLKQLWKRKDWEALRLVAHTGLGWSAEQWAAARRAERQERQQLRAGAQQAKRQKTEARLNYSGSLQRDTHAHIAFDDQSLVPYWKGTGQRELREAVRLTRAQLGEQARPDLHAQQQRLEAWVISEQLRGLGGERSAEWIRGHYRLCGDATYQWNLRGVYGDHCPSWSARGPGKFDALHVIALPAGVIALWALAPLESGDQGEGGLLKALHRTSVHRLGLSRIAAVLTGNWEEPLSQAVTRALANQETEGLSTADTKALGIDPKELQTSWRSGKKTMYLAAEVDQALRRKARQQSEEGPGETRTGKARQNTPVHTGSPHEPTGS